MANLKNILIIIGVIIILLLGTFIGGYQYAKKVYTTNPATYTNVIVQRDTVWSEKIVEKPVPYEVIKRDTIFKMSTKDSTEALNNYFTQNLYHIPLQFGDLNFKITQNSMFDLKIKTFTTNTTTYIKPLYMLGFGGSVGYIFEKPYLSFDAMYIKNFNTFNLSITYPFGVRIGYKYAFIKYK